jgi:hypothetical protein
MLWIFKELTKASSKTGTAFVDLVGLVGLVFKVGGAFGLVVFFLKILTGGPMIIVPFTGWTFAVLCAFVVDLTVVLVVLVVFLLRTIPAEADIAMMPREINDT